MTLFDIAASTANAQAAAYRAQLAVGIAETLAELQKRNEPENDDDEPEACYFINGDRGNPIPHDWTDAGEGFSRCRHCREVRQQ